MQPPPPRPPLRFAETLWAYRRMALRARSLPVYARLTNVLIDELVARDVALREMGYEPPVIYDLNEIAMLVRGCHVIRISDAPDSPQAGI
jgi:hypothetical protein